MRKPSFSWVSHPSYHFISGFFSFSHFALVCIAGFMAMELETFLHNKIILSLDAAVKITIVSAIFIFAGLKGYKDKTEISFTKNGISVLHVIWTVAAVLAIVALLEPSDTLHKADNIYWYFAWFFMTVPLILASNFIEDRVLKKLVRHGSLQKKIAVFGAGDIAKKVHDHLQDSASEICFSGLYDDRTNDRVDTMGLTIKGKLSDLVQAGQQNKIDQIIIALPQSAHSRIDYIAKKLEQLPLDITICTHIAEDVFSHPGREMHVSTIGSIGLLNIKQQPINAWGQIQKKVLDYTLSAIALIGLTPLLALIAIAIKLESKGSVIFRQKRHGLNHSEINVCKFRTMSVQENGAKVQQAQKNDPRVTKVGAFLRKTSLDELPQLVNVLRGEMSLVGPRPHALVHNEQYQKIIEEYANRHQVKPGLTGWAQVNGKRGETKEVKHMEDRVYYDLEYINDWSFLKDIKIILMTPFYALMSKNAY